jgi:hypothetical protein
MLRGVRSPPRLGHRMGLVLTVAAGAGLYYALGHSHVLRVVVGILLTLLLLGRLSELAGRRRRRR